MMMIVLTASTFGVRGCQTVHLVKEWALIIFPAQILR